MLLLGYFSIGVAFGFFLEKSKVFEPSIIIKQMLFKNFTMLKVFLSAISSGLIVISLFSFLGIINLYPFVDTYFHSIIGGSLLGVGIMLAGACPGTVMAQIGVGYKDALFTVLGAIIGSIGFRYILPYMNFIGASSTPKIATVYEFYNLPYWQVALVASIIIFLVALLLKIIKSDDN